ncbi:MULTISPECIES: sensor domain-containing diguanylate cyclase [Vibrio]|uniref:sensor domain-containing diguanylate cyclase n=1 Tax=Vibrio TaxID=662 RepID=UPI002075BB24|nr:MULTISPECIES: sensor domain-containing diguanylate cyclase [Vibrio]USD34439.1 sensor domain-containing diguanylate cyclase [Vibrio sp. SCSIO 43186]USD47511.1 sensor domain-containing diguanylate cyclase [Vibrio sp. SCSIO 43145]USD71564.1 sensor domain-containing diguanylate cyclase [Vibrio sp. SCSIO 43139]USD98470.1 hypothetical protein CTT30_20850 [Vibrio coralliilyticus]
MEETNYLKSELYNLVSKDDSIFEFIYQYALDGIWYWDTVDGNNEWMSPGFWELLGYDPQEMEHLASEWQDIINSEDLETAIVNFQKHCENPEHSYDQVVRYQHKDGSTIWVRCRGVGIRDETGKVIRMLGAHTDVTQIKLAEEQLKEANEQLKKANAQLEKMNLQDHMTKLLNRNGLEKKFEELLALCKRKKLPLSISVIDVDNFKAINDKYGHLVGDEFLIIIADSIKRAQRTTDACARLGGDEFMVLMLDADLDQAKQGAERIRSTIQKQFVEPYALTVSIGVSSINYQELALCQSDKESIQNILRHMIKIADKAMYQSKASGKNTVSSHAIKTISYVVPPHISDLYSREIKS